MFPIFLKFHLAFVVLSILLYSGRAVLSFTKSTLVNKPAVVITVKGVMLLVLLSAAALSYSIGQYPFVDGWLTEKLVGLIAYVVLGVVSFKPGIDTKVRALLILLTFAVFAFILLVAKQQAGFVL